MKSYSLSHLSDPVLLRDLAALVVEERTTTAALLAHLAEVDARKLYLPAAHPSMFSYCVHELHLSEDAASKRIQAARVARRFPGIFESLAAGRLHLSAVVLLAPYLTPENAPDLLAAAAHRSKSEIEELLAQRFPRSETLGLVQALPASPPRADEQLAPGQVEVHGSEALGAGADQHAPGHVETHGPNCLGSPAGQHAPGHVGTRSKLGPVAPERFRLELTIGRGTQDKLRYAQELLGHQLPSGDLAQVLDRALDALIEQLERRKFGATTRPRRSPRPSRNPRHIPAHVRRAVWERDHGQCTFVSEAGQRCPARKPLEFDHIEEVARGGRATVAGIRLRCRAHNQYAAECAFGAEFMRRQREAAQRMAATRRLDNEARAAARDAAAREAAARAQAVAEVIPWLRQLGLRADEARRAAARCETIPEAPLEQRVRVALSGSRGGVRGSEHPPGTQPSGVS